MPQDAYTLRYLCEELNVLFAGGKINRIVQPDNDVTVLTAYCKSGVKKLLLDVNPSRPRIGVTDTEKKAEGVAPNFCALLRKHLLSATVDRISLVGFDRIVRIDLTPSAEFFDAPPKALFVELMGRYSNVILTENGKVMGSNRGINFLDNNVRPLISGREYRLPPVGDKKPPTDKSLAAFFEERKDDLVNAICQGVQGIALSTAKEIAGSFDFSKPFSGEDFRKYLENFVYSAEKRPCVFTENGAATEVCVFPYKGLSGEIKFFDSLYLAEEYYYADRADRKAFKDLADRLNGIVSTALKKAKKRYAAVMQRVTDAEGAEDNRIKGELILANIYRIKAGADSVILTNYYDGTEITVFLDPRLSPAQNAETYYKKYNKQKRALSLLEPQKKIAEEETDYLESVGAEISLAKDISDLIAVKEELTAVGRIKSAPVRKGVKKEDGFAPRKYNVCGFSVKVGRNNTENDRLTFSAKPWDIWLHAKDYHSAHVIIETENKPVPQKAIIVAAEITAYYSKGRDGGKTEVVYCEKKRVKKPRAAAPGFCTYTDFSSVIVSPSERAEYLVKPCAAEKG